MDAELTIASLKGDRLANSVTWLQDGEQALDYVFRRGAYEQRTDLGPRLILLDLKMPGLDGIDVLKAIRAEPADQAHPGRDDDVVARGKQ